MLILERGVEEAIIIGEGPDAVRILITGIGRRSVKVGIQAPRRIRVLREELLDRRPDDGAALARRLADLSATDAAE